MDPARTPASFLAISRRSTWHSNFRSFRRSEVGIGEKKEDDRCLLYNNFRFFHPKKSVKHVFLNIRFELSLRPYSYSAESSAFQVTPRESPETSKNPRDDVMCETIMVMFQYLQEVVATSCDTQFVRIWCHDMSCVATTWVAWNTLTFPNIIRSLSCPGSTGRLKPCLRKKTPRWSDVSRRGNERKQPSTSEVTYPQKGQSCKLLWGTTMWFFGDQHCPHRWSWKHTQSEGSNKNYQSQSFTTQLAGDSVANWRCMENAGDVKPFQLCACT